jgi:Na+/melibiose symporter-like transporter
MLDSANTSLAFIVLAIAGFFSGGVGPFAPTLLATVVDEDESSLGEPRAATYSALWDLTEKIAGAVIVLIVALTLQFSGYVPNQPLSAMADIGLRLCLAVLPAIGFCATAILLRHRHE